MVVGCILWKRANSKPASRAKSLHHSAHTSVSAVDERHSPDGGCQTWGKAAERNRSDKSNIIKWYWYMYLYNRCLKKVQKCVLIYVDTLNRSINLSAFTIKKGHKIKNNEKAGARHKMQRFVQPWASGGNDPRLQRPTTLAGEPSRGKNHGVKHWWIWCAGNHLSVPNQWQGYGRTSTTFQTMQWVENDVFQTKSQLLGYRRFGFSSETLRQKSQRCSSCSPCKQLHSLGNARFLLQNRENRWPK